MAFKAASTVNSAVTLLLPAMSTMNASAGTETTQLSTAL